MAHRNRRDIPTILRYKGNQTGHSTDRKLLCHSRITHKKETTVVLIYGFTNKLQARLVPATLSLLEDWGSLDHTTCCFGMAGKLKNKKHQCWWRVLISASLQGSPLPCNERNDPAGVCPVHKATGFTQVPSCRVRTWATTRTDGHQQQNGNRIWFAQRSEMQRYKCLVRVTVELYNSKHETRRGTAWCPLPKQQHAYRSPHANNESFPPGHLHSHLGFPDYEKIGLWNGENPI